jgi:hypothetical protein
VDGTTVLTLERRDGATFPCFVDTSDYELIKRHRWYSIKDERTYYAATVMPNGKQTLLHQLFLGPGADHRDHNGLNNRRSNLRAATTEQNGGNRRKGKGSSWYKGVSPRPGGTFEAQIRVRGKLIYLGKFDSEIKAAQTYDAAARKHFGKFAAVNFPQPGEQGASIKTDDTPEGEEP